MWIALVLLVAAVVGLLILNGENMAAIDDLKTAVAAQGDKLTALEARVAGLPATADVSAAAAAIAANNVRIDAIAPAA
jgi:outer membrane murein-binding lipoprotein Lpp